MAPRGSAKRHSIVVGHSGEVEAVVGQLVPLLARDLARFAADADGGVGEETLTLAVVRHFPPSSRAI